MFEYQWVEHAMSVSVSAAKPNTILASPRFMRAFKKSKLGFDAEMEFDIRFGLFDGMKRGARNRKRKRFIRRYVQQRIDK